MNKSITTNVVAVVGLVAATLFATLVPWIDGVVSDRITRADLRGSNCDAVFVGTVNTEPLVTRGDFDEPCWSEGGVGIVPVDSYWRLVAFDTDGGTLSVVGNRPANQLRFQLEMSGVWSEWGGSIETEVNSGRYYLKVALPRLNNAAPVEFELTLRILPDEHEEPPTPPTVRVTPEAPTPIGPTIPVTESPPTVAPQPPMAELSEQTECALIYELTGEGTDPLEIFGELDASDGEAACPQHSYAFYLPSGRSFDLTVASNGVLLELERPDGDGIERLIAPHSTTLGESGRYVFRVQRLAYAVGLLNYQVNIRLITPEVTVDQVPPSPEPGTWREWQFEGSARSTSSGLNLTGRSSATARAQVSGRITHLYLDFALKMPSDSCERAVLLVSRGDDAWNLLTSFTHEDSNSEFTRVGFDLRDIRGRPFSEQLELKIQSAFVADDTWLQVRNLVVSSSTEAISGDLEREYNTGGGITLGEGESCFGAYSGPSRTLIAWKFSAKRNYRYSVRVQSLGHYRPYFQVESPSNDRGSPRTIAGDAGESSARDDFRAEETGIYVIWVSNRPGPTPGEGLYRIIVTERGRDVDDPPTPEAVPTELPIDGVSQFILDHCKRTGYADGCIDEAEDLLFQMFGEDAPTHEVETGEPTPIVVAVGPDSPEVVFAPLSEIVSRCDGSLRQLGCSADSVAAELRRMARAVTDAFNENLGTNFTDDVLTALFGLMIEMSPDQGTLEAYRTGVTCGRPCWESGWDGDEILEGREWAFLLGWTYSSIVPGWGNVHAARDLAYEINQCRGIIADGREGCSGVDIALDGIGIVPLVGGPARAGGAVAIRGLRQTTRWGWVDGAWQGAKKLFSGALEHVFKPFRNTLIRWFAPQIGWSLHQFSKLNHDWALKFLLRILPDNYDGLTLQELRQYGRLIDGVTRDNLLEPIAGIPGVFLRSGPKNPSFVEIFQKGRNTDSSRISFGRVLHHLRHRGVHDIIEMEAARQVPADIAYYYGIPKISNLDLTPDIIRRAPDGKGQIVEEIKSLRTDWFSDPKVSYLDPKTALQLSKEIAYGTHGRSRFNAFLFVTENTDTNLRAELLKEIKKYLPGYANKNIKEIVDDKFSVIWYTRVDDDLARLFGIQQ